ncbi:hypothetical protein DMP15_18675 [Pseudonocardia sp. UM4_GMWB1]|uniref:hypothetical protein n=1 Tax=Pseudonocardia sp. UM4_GMWB1 TaxID=2212989 RepID=UPI00307DEA7C
MSSDVGPVPGWVVPVELAVRDCLIAAYQVYDVADDTAAGGAFAAVNWVLRPATQPGPATDRTEAPSWEIARGESWAALCAAAGQEEPTGWDWYRLGASPRPTRIVDPAWCYGAWRALSWLLGVRPDPPVELPDRDADGAVVPGSQRYVARPDRDRPAWQDAQRARRGRETGEALRHWRHIRELADRTRTAG